MRDWTMMLVAAAFAAGAPLAASAQDTAQTAPVTEPAPMTPDATAEPMTPDAGADAMATGAAMAGGLPVCSASVRDKCQQSAAAERLAAKEYSDNLPHNDNSAMLDGRGGKRPARRNR